MLDTYPQDETRENIPAVEEGEDREAVTFFGRDCAVGLERALGFDLHDSLFADRSRSILERGRASGDEHLVGRDAFERGRERGHRDDGDRAVLAVARPEGEPHGAGWGVSQDLGNT